MPGPAWDGGDLTGKTIALYTEHGLGDTLQFCRYVPLLKAPARTRCWACGRRWCG